MMFVQWTRDEGMKGRRVVMGVQLCFSSLVYKMSTMHVVGFIDLGLSHCVQYDLQAVQRSELLSAESVVYSKLNKQPVQVHHLQI